MSLKIFATVFVTVFLAELGDKTQLATMSFSSGSRQFWTVFLASASALVLSSLLASLVGKWLGQVLPMRWLLLSNSLIFLVIGLSLFAHAWHLFAGGTERSPIEAPLYNTRYRLRVAAPLSGPYHADGLSFVHGVLLALDDHHRPAATPSATPPTCVALEVIDYTTPATSTPPLAAYDTGFILDRRLTSLVRFHNLTPGLVVDLRLMAPFLEVTGGTTPAGPATSAPPSDGAPGSPPQAVPAPEPETSPEEPTLAWMSGDQFRQLLAGATIADDSRHPGFRAAFRRRFDREPDFLAAHGYDLASYLLSLLASQPEARLELLGKLQGMDFAGLSGRFAHHPSLPFDRSPDPEP